MTRTQYYTATTMDGYIADDSDSLDWLFEVQAEPGDRFEGFMDGVGAFVMGATTYKWVLSHERVVERPKEWLRWYGQRPCWVFTHHELPVVPGADIRFVHGDVRPVHEEMVTAAGWRNVWLVGGGELVGTFADHGLLDDIVLGVAPVTLGGGAPVLPRRLTGGRIRLTGVEQDGQFAYLTYQVLGGSSDDQARR
ncbi:dihydrofolate reductase family protein [Streptomyces sp. NPDC049040]|uniref:dihydrofolate reductase family protein n=1 Tax=Streptomyces sp. NPDC049040 TaxID=3365593 RepID=UPI0037214182